MCVTGAPTVLRVHAPRSTPCSCCMDGCARRWVLDKKEVRRRMQRQKMSLLVLLSAMGLGQAANDDWSDGTYMKVTNGNCANPITSAADCRLAAIAAGFSDTTVNEANGVSLAVSTYGPIGCWYRPYPTTPDEALNFVPAGSTQNEGFSCGSYYHCFCRLPAPPPQFPPSLPPPPSSPPSPPSPPPAPYWPPAAPSWGLDPDGLRRLPPLPELLAGSSPVFLPPNCSDAVRRSQAGCQC